VSVNAAPFSWGISIFHGWPWHEKSRSFVFSVSIFYTFSWIPPNMGWNSKIGQHSPKQKSFENSEKNFHKSRTSNRFFVFFVIFVNFFYLQISYPEDRVHIWHESQGELNSLTSVVVWHPSKIPYPLPISCLCVLNPIFFSTCRAYIQSSKNFDKWEKISTINSKNYINFVEALFLFLNEHWIKFFMGKIKKNMLFDILIQN